MANISVTYSFTNGTTADGPNVSTNFTDIINGLSDGSKDISVSAITAAGVATFNGNVNIGNASGDDLSITASLASSIPIKTNNTYDIGSATLGLRKLYLGNGGAGATCDIVAASHATTREYTVPDCSAAASFVMTQATQTISGTKTFDGQLIGKGTVTNDDAAASYIGEAGLISRVRSNPLSLTNATVANLCTTTNVVFQPGDYWISAIAVFQTPNTTVVTEISAAVSATSATNPGADTIGVPTAGEFRVIDGVGYTSAGTTHRPVIIPPFRLTVATATTKTLYLVVEGDFSISTMTAYGSLTWRRAR